MNSDEMMIGWQESQPQQPQQQQQQPQQQQVEIQQRSSTSSTPSLQSQQQSPISPSKNINNLNGGTLTTNSLSSSTTTTNRNDDSSPSSPQMNQSPTSNCNSIDSNCNGNNNHLLQQQQQQQQQSVSINNKENIQSNLDDLIKNVEIAMGEKNYDVALKYLDNYYKLAESHTVFDYMKNNLKFYILRGKANLNLGNLDSAHNDYLKARGINDKCGQVYYLHGQVTFSKGLFEDSFAVFSFGLAQDPINNYYLLDALVKAILKSNYHDSFETNYKLLKERGYDRPFIVVAVIGQQLLDKKDKTQANLILESALKIENFDNNNNKTSNENNNDDNFNYKKFKGSLFSSIAYTYYSLKIYDKTLLYMQKEFDIESELEDDVGRCRVLSNLGNVYYKLGIFDKSLEFHRKQVDLAMRTSLFKQASNALNAIGHVHAARNDFSSALTSHTRCLDLLKQLGDNDYNQYKELISLGHIHLMLGDYRQAEEKYKEAISLKQNSSMFTLEELKAASELEQKLRILIKKSIDR